MAPLGLIAGGGTLPQDVARAALASGRPLYVIRLKGFADPGLSAFDGAEAGLGEFGRVIELLRRAGCRQVCFAGNVSRPDFSTLMPDLKGLAVLPGLIGAARQGDDALLRQVLSVFAEAGFEIIGADQVLAPNLLPAGALAAHAPHAEHRDDIARALHVAREAGRLDIGQGAVVCDGLVLAVEAQEGTDAMLGRVAGLPQPLRGRPEARRGVLAKAPKPIQERKVDLPVIGPRTVELAAAAGLAGLVGEAGGVIVLERDRVIALADGLGLFIWGEP